MILHWELRIRLLDLGAIPGSIGRELLADIASLIISSEFQDVMFGTPRPVQSKIGFNVLDKNKVNVVIHGHVPLLSEKLVELSEDEELLNKARAMGASGINIVGCCCTGNEVLMRHGIPLAGSN